MDNASLMAELIRWAREDARIDPGTFDCRFYSACNAHGQLCHGEYCSMSFIGRQFGEGFRLAVVGMDHGDRETANFADRRKGIEDAYQPRGAGWLNPHYQGTVKVAAAVLGSADCAGCAENAKCQRSRGVACVIDRIAQPNVVKCVPVTQEGRQSKATATMWGNCAHHLVAELRLLRPELVIFLGADARWAVPNAIQPEVLDAIEGIEDRNGQPALYNWPALNMHLLFLCHPSSRPRTLFDREWDKTGLAALDYLRARGLIPDAVA
jgi:hypothetical protein